MRYSYGIVQGKTIVTYKPHLFHNYQDLLVFPAENFRKWHSQINEYLDGVYQVNAHKQEKKRPVDRDDLNLVLGVLCEITLEMEELFNPEKETDNTYYYISTMDEDYKKIKTTFYGRYRYKIERKTLPITPELKYQHILEIVQYAHKLWGQNNRGLKLNMVSRKE
jgi:hypothetical protein